MLTLCTRVQASAAANSQAWAAAEASLTARLNDAEGSAAAAGEREKRAWEKVQAANTRLAASAAALDALKTELADADSGDCVCLTTRECCMPIDVLTGSVCILTMQSLPRRLAHSITADCSLG